MFSLANVAMLSLGKFQEILITISSEQANGWRPLSRTKLHTVTECGMS